LPNSLGPEGESSRAKPQAYTAPQGRLARQRRFPARPAGTGQGSRQPAAL